MENDDESRLPRIEDPGRKPSSADAQTVADSHTRGLWRDSLFRNHDTSPSTARLLFEAVHGTDGR